jgi:hypothetical protein
MLVAFFNSKPSLLKYDFTNFTCFGLDNENKHRKGQKVFG